MPIVPNVQSCVCCAQNHTNVQAWPGARWCHQCQKDGCEQPELKDDELEVVEAKCVRCLRLISVYIPHIHKCRINIGGIFDLNFFLCELCRVPVVEAVQASLLALKGDDGRLKAADKRNILL